MSSNPAFNGSDGLVQRRIKSDLDKEINLNDLKLNTITHVEPAQAHAGAADQEQTIEESPSTILMQVILPFFIAGFGMVAAGVLLDVVQYWDLYQEMNEIFTLVPALLGLKGNLEMTLASRLSTQVNCGLIHDRKTTTSAVIGNFALIQLQSIIIGLLASGVACLTEFIQTGNFNSANLLTLIASSVGTASLASFLLAGLMMFLIILSKRYNINPDNVATPIASSLGDLVTLAILSGLGTFLYENKETSVIHITLISLFVLSIPILVIICYKNEFVRETLFEGWVPVISAMLIASLAGFILGIGVKIYSVIAVYQPVVNGVGGNLVAIFASRLSTSLHKTSTMGVPASWQPHSFLSYPYETFFGTQNPEANTGKILLGLILPGHSIFFFALYFLKAKEGGVELTVWLVLFYLIMAFIQVSILLLLCYWLVHLVWRLKKDPDNVCIPYLTAIGDFLGVSFLFICFHLVYLTGNETLTAKLHVV